MEKRVSYGMAVVVQTEPGIPGLRKVSAFMGKRQIERILNGMEHPWNDGRRYFHATQVKPRRARGAVQ